MKTVEVSQSALESLQKMVEKLQGERDELLLALDSLLQRDISNTCTHETTHRGGAIWEICDDCGAKWADDRGGKPKWKDPKEWEDAKEIIAKCTAKPEVLE